MSTADAATEEERGAAPTEASLQRSPSTAEQQGMIHEPESADGKKVESNENTATAATLPSDDAARTTGENQNPSPLDAPTAAGGAAATAPAPVPPNPHQHLILIRQEREFLEHQHALTLQKEQLLLQQVKGLPPAAAAAAAPAVLLPKGESNTAANQIQPLPKKKDTKWLATYEELLAYKRQHGDCVVPRGYPPNPRLASWVAENRKQYVRTKWLVLPIFWAESNSVFSLLFRFTRSIPFRYKLMQDGKPTCITKERVQLLQKIGFAWNAQESAWANHYENLKLFRAQNGHCQVPLEHPLFPKLGLWVKEQRRHNTLLKQGKKCHMTADRIQKLNDIDFCWDTHHFIWMDRVRELAEFKKQKGHCSVPTNYASNTKLATWVHHQRRQYKKFLEGKPCHITQVRIDQLNALGFNWNPRAEDKSSSSTAAAYKNSSTAATTAPHTLNGVVGGGILGEQQHPSENPAADDEDGEEYDFRVRRPFKRRRTSQV